MGIIRSWERDGSPRRCHMRLESDGSLFHFLTTWVQSRPQFFFIAILKSLLPGILAWCTSLELLLVILTVSSLFFSLCHMSPMMTDNCALFQLGCASLNFGKWNLKKVMQFPFSPLFMILFFFPIMAISQACSLGCCSACSSQGLRPVVLRFYLSFCSKFLPDSLEGVARGSTCLCVGESYSGRQLRRSLGDSFSHSRMMSWMASVSLMIPLPLISSEYRRRENYRQALLSSGLIDTLDIFKKQQLRTNSSLLN